MLVDDKKNSIKRYKTLIQDLVFNPWLQLLNPELIHGINNNNNN